MARYEETSSTDVESGISSSDQEREELTIKKGQGKTLDTSTGKGWKQKRGTIVLVAVIALLIGITGAWFTLKPDGSDISGDKGGEAEVSVMYDSAIVSSYDPTIRGECDDFLDIVERDSRAIDPSITLDNRARLPKSWTDWFDAGSKSFPGDDWCERLFSPTSGVYISAIVLLGQQGNVQTHLIGGTCRECSDDEIQVHPDSFQRLWESGFLSTGDRASAGGKNTAKARWFAGSVLPDGGYRPLARPESGKAPDPPAAVGTPI